MPSNTDEECILLGLPNYCHQFVAAFPDLMHPIQRLLKKNIKFKWSDKCDKAFRIAKETLTNNPLLHHPDPNILWIIETDASKTAFSGVLLQPHTHKGITQEVPITFIS